MEIFRADPEIDRRVWNVTVAGWLYSDSAWCSSGVTRVPLPPTLAVACKMSSARALARSATFLSFARIDLPLLEIPSAARGADRGSRVPETMAIRRSGSFIPRECVVFSQTRWFDASAASSKQRRCLRTVLARGERKSSAATRRRSFAYFILHLVASFKDRWRNSQGSNKDHDRTRTTRK